MEENPLKFSVSKAPSHISCHLLKKVAVITKCLMSRVERGQLHHQHVRLGRDSLWLVFGQRVRR